MKKKAISLFLCVLMALFTTLPAHAVDSGVGDPAESTGAAYEMTEGFRRFAIRRGRNTGFLKPTPL